MKEICKINISFPVLRYKSAVNHSTPRKMTVIDKILLKTHDKFSEHDIYKDVSLEKIFTDIFCMPDPDGLVRPCINNLVMLGAFRPKKDIKALKYTALRDLELTPLGNQILKEGGLPAAPVENDIVHVYDPVLDRPLNKAGQRRLNDAKSNLSIDESPFLDVYPTETIARDIIENRPHWFYKNSRIDRIKRRKTSVLWSEATGALLVSEKGKLAFSFKDEARTGYVNGLDKDVLFKRFVTPLLTIDNGDFAKCLPTIDFKEVYPKIKRCFPVRQINRQIEFNKQMYFMQEIPGVFKAPSVAPDKTIVAIFNVPGAQSGGKIEWNENQTGLRISLPDPFPAPGVIYYNSKGCCIGASRFKLKLKNKSYETPIAYSYSEGHLLEELSLAKKKVEKCLEKTANAEIKDLIPERSRK